MTQFWAHRALLRNLFLLILGPACTIVLVAAGDGDFCTYNSLPGFCVTTDNDHHSDLCHTKHGWLQFYMGTPPPRHYIGCGDDGVVYPVVKEVNNDG